MPIHKQVFAKVNVEVDEGIVSVVAALSLFNDVHTIESCQGYPEEENHRTLSAVVYFRVGNADLNLRERLQITSDFVFGFLAPRLWKRGSDCANVSMEFCNGDTYDCAIRMFPESIPGVAEAIVDAYHERMSGFKDGCRAA